MCKLNLPMCLKITLEEQKISCVVSFFFVSNVMFWVVIQVEVIIFVEELMVVKCCHVWDG